MIAESSEMSQYMMRDRENFLKELRQKNEEE